MSVGVGTGSYSRRAIKKNKVTLQVSRSNEVQEDLKFLFVSSTWLNARTMLNFPIYTIHSRLDFLLLRTTGYITTSMPILTTLCTKLCILYWVSFNIDISYIIIRDTTAYYSLFYFKL